MKVPKKIISILFLGSLLACPLLIKGLSEGGHVEGHEPVEVHEGPTEAERAEEQAERRKAEEAKAEREKAEKQAEEERRKAEAAKDGGKTPDGDGTPAKKPVETPKGGGKTEDGGDKSGDKKPVDPAETAAEEKAAEERELADSKSGLDAADKAEVDTVKEIEKIKATKEKTEKLMQETLKAYHIKGDASLLARGNHTPKEMVGELRKAVEVKKELKEELKAVTPGSEAERVLSRRLTEVESVETLWRAKIVQRIESSMGQILDPAGYSKGVDTFSAVQEKVEDPSQIPQEEEPGSFWQRIKSGVKATGSAVKEGVKTAGLTVKEGVKAAGRGVKEGVKSGVKRVGDLFRDPPSKPEYGKAADRLNDYSKELNGLSLELAGDPAIKGIKDLVRLLRVKAEIGEKGQGDRAVDLGSEAGEDADLDQLDKGSPAQQMKSLLVREINTITAEAKEKAGNALQEVGKEKEKGVIDEGSATLNELAGDLGSIYVSLRNKATAHHRTVRLDAKATRVELDKTFDSVDKLLSKGDVKSASDALKKSQKTVNEKLTDLEMTRKHLEDRFNSVEKDNPNYKEQLSAKKKLDNEIKKLYNRKVDLDLRVQEAQLNEKVTDISKKSESIKLKQRGTIKRLYDRMSRRVNDFLIDLGLGKIKGASSPQKQAESLVTGVDALTKGVEVNGPDGTFVTVPRLVAHYTTERLAASGKVTNQIGRLNAEIDGDLAHSKEHGMDGKLSSGRRQQLREKVADIRNKTLQELLDRVAATKEAETGVLEFVTSLNNFIASKKTVEGVAADFAKIAPGGKFSPEAMKKSLKIDSSGRATDLEGLNSAEVGSSMLIRDKSKGQEMAKKVFELEGDTSTEGTLKARDKEEILDTESSISTILKDYIAEIAPGGKEEEYTGKLKELSELLRRETSEHPNGLIHEFYQEALELGQTTLRNLSTKSYTDWTPQEFTELGGIREGQFIKETATGGKGRTAEEIQAVRNISSYPDNAPEIIDLMAGKESGDPAVSAETLDELHGKKMNLADLNVGLGQEFEDGKKDLLDVEQKLTDLEARIKAMPTLEDAATTGKSDGDGDTSSLLDKILGKSK